MIFAGKEYTGKGIKVAVINTGIDGECISNVVAGWTLSLQATGHVFVEPGGQDISGRGTKIAQCIISEAPDVELIAINIFNTEGRTNSDLLAAAIETAHTVNASVINVSFGTSNMGKALLLRDACTMAVEAGAMIVTSGHPKGEVSYPADIPETVGVISHKDCNHKSYYFDPSFFPEKEWQSMSGKMMCSGIWDGKYRGSGYAAARLSAQVACLREANPTASIADIYEILQYRAYLPQLGFGYD